MLNFASLAYVDPGSGSMMVQLMLGGVSGIYVIFRLYKKKVLGLFGIHPESNDPTNDVQQAPQKEDQLRQKV
jgi:hypothetical protein